MNDYKSVSTPIDCRIKLSRHDKGKTIDGTHISARVPGNDQVRFRGKRVAPTQNIMCACAFDMTLTYVMVGWEGTANDSNRVFMETITKPSNDFALPPPGKYYLVDSGYTNMPGFLAPSKLPD